LTLRTGKLDPALLAGMLARINSADSRVIIGPGIGRDAAVIDFGSHVLVATTDPVTFAADRIGWYAVNVNANDIACMGARPCWFMAAVLLPPGAADNLPGEIFDQLLEACAGLGIELVGGHTEVTAGLDRPIVAGAMIGEADRDAIVTGENVRPGDSVLLTKGIAIEGTALLAREAAALLQERGVAEPTIRAAQALLLDPGISVVRDAQAVCAAARPRLMHDPTEGGVATALEEMAVAAGFALAVDVEAISVLAETRAVCEALALDPLGLLSSGALLAIVAAPDVERVAAGLAGEQIACHMIGTVESGPPTVIMAGSRRVDTFPRFDRDEIARFFESQTHSNH
jgi:hydrogenase maturation factor